jgi:hypothetical protein
MLDPQSIFFHENISINFEEIEDFDFDFKINHLFLNNKRKIARIYLILIRIKEKLLQLFRNIYIKNMIIQIKL